MLPKIENFENGFKSGDFLSQKAVVCGWAKTNTFENTYPFIAF